MHNFYINDKTSASIHSFIQSLIHLSIQPICRVQRKKKEFLHKIIQPLDIFYRTHHPHHNQSTQVLILVIVIEKKSLTKYKAPRFRNEFYFFSFIVFIGKIIIRVYNF